MDAAVGLDAMDRFILEGYRSRLLREMAQNLGVRPETVQVRLTRLIHQGLAQREARAYQPPWNPADEAWLREHVGRPGWTLPVLAERLGRSEAAVRLKLKRLRVRKPVKGRSARTLRLRDVMEVMGLGGNHRPARHWIRQGLLTAHRLPVAGKRPIYAIYPADLVEFLQAYPEAYEKWRMPVTLGGKRNPYREVAREPTGCRDYLPVKRAAAELGVVVKTLRRWVHEGRIAAVHRSGPGIHAQEWFIHRPVLEAARRRMVRLPNGWWSLPAEAA